jgi:hypothetical protein
MGSYSSLTVALDDIVDPDWGNSVRDRVIHSYANDAARDAEITSPVTGNIVHLQDTNSIWVYTGAAWELFSAAVMSARLTADAAGITTNTVLGNIAGLSKAVVASHVYQLSGKILYTAGGGAGAGQLKIGWTAPAGSTLLWSPMGLVVNGASGVSGSITTDGSVLADARSFGAGGASTCSLHVDGILTVGGASGTFQFQAAQAASSATATVIKAGSHFELELLS